MSRWWGIVLVGLALACNGAPPPDPHATPVPGEPAPAPAVEPVPEPVVEPAPEALPAPEPTPTSGDAAPEPEVDWADPAVIYAGCRDRVEQPENAGECKTSADCGSGGCSGEMCVAKSLGAITSTCEVRACFGVLDTCGCVEGKCQWSLKAAAPPRRTMPPLDVQ